MDTASPCERRTRQGLARPRPLLAHAFRGHKWLERRAWHAPISSPRTQDPIRLRASCRATGQPRPSLEAAPKSLVTVQCRSTAPAMRSAKCRSGGGGREEIVQVPWLWRERLHRRIGEGEEANARSKCGRGGGGEANSQSGGGQDADKTEVTGGRMRYTPIAPEKAQAVHKFPDHSRCIPPRRVYLTGAASTRRLGPTTRTS